MASISELFFVYLALILHEDEVTGRIKSMPSLKQQVYMSNLSVLVCLQGCVANTDVGSLICNVGVGGAAPAAGSAPTRGAVPAASSAEEKTEETKESDDDMGFGLFD
ncbi:60S acidic ribosomal protein P1-like [Trichosurus vulpecula]|uniref:60S acidic ribosomal protein P1-like n=1 Tax=Trichosurus vulpecula TaxID=9337 RepID=UPI00186B4D6C|nr:60S acidic ribosomal protein P1-like [Trichosurus vulpecula]